MLNWHDMQRGLIVSPMLQAKRPACLLRSRPPRMQATLHSPRPTPQLSAANSRQRRMQLRPTVCLPQGEVQRQPLPTVAPCSQPWQQPRRKAMQLQKSVGLNSRLRGQLRLTLSQLQR